MCELCSVLCFLKLKLVSFCVVFVSFCGYMENRNLRKLNCSLYNLRKFLCGQCWDRFFSKYRKCDFVRHKAWVLIVPIFWKPDTNQLGSTFFSEPPGYVNLSATSCSLVVQGKLDILISTI